jgi:spermidine synthase
MTYPGGLWSFGFAGKQLCPIRDFDSRRVEKAEITTRYYNPGIHRAAFMLPSYLQNILKEVLDPITWRA